MVDRSMGSLMIKGKFSIAFSSGCGARRGRGGCRWLVLQ